MFVGTTAGGFSCCLQSDGFNKVIRLLDDSAILVAFDNAWCQKKKGNGGGARCCWC